MYPGLSSDTMFAKGTVLFLPPMKVCVRAKRALNGFKHLSSKGFMDFDLKAKARFWPRLSDICHIRATAAYYTAGYGVILWIYPSKPSGEY